MLLLVHIQYNIHEIPPKHIYTGGAGEDGGFLKERCTLLTANNGKYLKYF